MPRSTQRTRHAPGTKSPGGRDVTQPVLATPRSGGRPRDTTRDWAIRRATLQLLAEVGFDGVTMDRVATRARAGKATIYRRWPSKVALVMDAITGFTEQTMQIPDTGTVRMDMVEFLMSFHETIGGDQGKILAELVSEMPRNAELRETLRNGLWAGRRAAAEIIVERGVARGEIRPDVDRTVLIELGTALILQRVLMSGDSVDRHFLEHIVDDVMLRLGSPAS
jgi:AcrR family transcriptional regulator